MASKALEALLAAALATGLIACGDDMGGGGGESETATTQKALVPPVRTNAPVETAPAVEPAVEEVPAMVAGDDEGKSRYVAEGKRDPFRSFHFKDIEKPLVSMGPLADFDLSQLSIVGVIWNIKNPRALVADPAGRSFVLKEGSAIGKNRGRVIRIEDDLILVEEKFVDFEGTVTTKDVEMRLAKSQGG
jgi:type IV pilus assembly protein PilP